MSGASILILVEDFEFWGSGKPLTEREAYMWLCAYGPAARKFSWLARQWRWQPQRARKFIYRMFNAGLVRASGKSIEAVGFDQARPALVSKSWRAVRAFVLARDSYACTYCGSKDDLQCDHILPRVRGGTDTVANLTTACGPCNASKGAKTPDEWKS